MCVCAGDESRHWLAATEALFARVHALMLAEREFAVSLRGAGVAEAQFAAVDHTAEACGGMLTAVATGGDQVGYPSLSITVLCVSGATGLK